jgi:hydroxymethylglutaryl-CoA reductase (NADPH)
VPVGVVGPLRVNGLFARDDFYVPLATTEAALVASYGRGARLISAAGGCAAAVLAEGVHRAPGFALANLADAGLFTQWVIAEQERLKAAADATSRYGRLVDLLAPHRGRPRLPGLHLPHRRRRRQNMVTIATEALCREIERSCPIKPVYWFVETNLSGDKKASAISFTSVRGRKVSRESSFPPAGGEPAPHHAPRMQDYWRMSALGGVMSGSIGSRATTPTGWRRSYLATGQDVACVAESGRGRHPLRAARQRPL